MRAISTFPQVYFYLKFVDFRKSINGLSEIVESEMKLKPFSSALFVFMGRRRDRVKVLYWDKTGFALWYKRLEEAKFSRARGFNQDVMTVSAEQFEWLLSGVDIWKMKNHVELKFEQIT